MSGAVCQWIDLNSVYCWHSFKQIKKLYNTFFFFLPITYMDMESQNEEEVSDFLNPTVHLYMMLCNLRDDFYSLLLI